MSKEVVNQYDSYLKDYFYETCREERQYALFLYNIFLRMKTQKQEKLDENSAKVIAACLYPSECKGKDNATEVLEKNGTEIVEVIYEVTVMRDFFERTRKEPACKFCMRENRRNPEAENEQKNSCSRCKYVTAVKELVKRKYQLNDEDKEVISEPRFNKQLIEFCYQRAFGKREMTEDEKRVYEQLPLYENLHAVKEKDWPEGLAGSEAEIFRRTQEMMHAKPDLAVLFKDKNGGKDNDKIRMVFLECKYLSSEGKGQIGIQQDVLEFLCGRNGILKGYQADGGKDVHLVRFWENDRQKKPEVQVTEMDSKSSATQISQINICKDLLLAANGLKRER